MMPIRLGSTPNSAACCRTSRTACCPSAPANSGTFWPACASFQPYRSLHRSSGISRQTRRYPSGSAVGRHPLLHTTSLTSGTRRRARRSSQFPPRSLCQPGNRAAPVERYSAPAACPACRRIFRIIPILRTGSRTWVKRNFTSRRSQLSPGNNRQSSQKADLWQVHTKHFENLFLRLLHSASIGLFHLAIRCHPDSELPRTLADFTS